MEEKTASQHTGEIIAGLRKKLGWTLEKFASQIGITGPSLLGIERGKWSPSEPTLAALSVLAARNGEPNYSEAFCVLLNTSLIGQVFNVCVVTRGQIDILRGQLAIAFAELRSGRPKQSAVMIEHAIERVQQLQSDIAKVIPASMPLELRSDGSNAYAN